ncbi:ankyrin repeat domain-containing protein 36A-like isoform X2 [Physella acuta]|uniref:ankyrin repeat domain-containing protein 36A-like isoform X2 n=1 Tax=Physella acuta TaxID=109671 RepID=UPI0027DDF00A|nr:ankyrin repeat domain-containing protein 36A-like isoform X2 [Physella acuta]
MSKKLDKFRRKKRGHLPKDSPFPIPLCSSTADKDCRQWYYYTGYIDGSSVVITHSGDMDFIYKKGFFGKGTLSRSLANFCDRKQKVDVQLPMTKDFKVSCIRPMVMNKRTYLVHKKYKALASGRTKEYNDILVHEERQQFHSDSSIDEDNSDDNIVNYQDAAKEEAFCLLNSSESNIPQSVVPKLSALTKSYLLAILGQVSVLSKEQITTFVRVSSDMNQLKSKFTQFREKEINLLEKMYAVKYPGQFFHKGEIINLEEEEEIESPIGKKEKKEKLNETVVILDSDEEDDDEMKDSQNVNTEENVEKSKNEEKGWNDYDEGDETFWGSKNDNKPPLNTNVTSSDENLSKEESTVKVDTLSEHTDIQSSGSLDVELAEKKQKDSDGEKLKEETSLDRQVSDGEKLKEETSLDRQGSDSDGEKLKEVTSIDRQGSDGEKLKEETSLDRLDSDGEKLKEVTSLDRQVSDGEKLKEDTSIDRQGSDSDGEKLKEVTSIDRQGSDSDGEKLKEETSLDRQGSDGEKLKEVTSIDRQGSDSDGEKLKESQFGSKSLTETDEKGNPSGNTVSLSLDKDMITNYFSAQADTEKNTEEIESDKPRTIFLDLETSKIKTAEPSSQNKAQNITVLEEDENSCTAHESSNCSDDVICIESKSIDGEKCKQLLLNSNKLKKKNPVVTKSVIFMSNNYKEPTYVSAKVGFHSWKQVLHFNFTGDQTHLPTSMCVAFDKSQSGTCSKLEPSQVVYERLYPPITSLIPNSKSKGAVMKQRLSALPKLGEAYSNVRSKMSQTFRHILSNVKQPQVIPHNKSSAHQQAASSTRHKEISVSSTASAFKNSPTVDLSYLSEYLNIYKKHIFLGDEASIKTEKDRKSDGCSSEINPHSSGNSDSIAEMVKSLQLVFTSSIESSHHKNLSSLSLKLNKILSKLFVHLSPQTEHELLCLLLLKKESSSHITKENIAEAVNTLSSFNLNILDIRYQYLTGQLQDQETRIREDPNILGNQNKCEIKSGNVENNQDGVQANDKSGTSKRKKSLDINQGLDRKKAKTDLSIVNIECKDTVDSPTDIDKSGHPSPSDIDMTTNKEVSLSKTNVGEVIAPHANVSKSSVDNLMDAQVDSSNEDNLMDAQVDASNEDNLMDAQVDASNEDSLMDADVDKNKDSLMDAEIKKKGEDSLVNTADDNQLRESAMIVSSPLSERGKHEQLTASVEKGVSSETVVAGSSEDNQICIESSSEDDCDRVQSSKSYTYSGEKQVHPFSRSDDEDCDTFVHDNTSDDSLDEFSENLSKSLKKTKWRPCLKKDPYPTEEVIHLMLEEAYFLSYGLGCLRVIDPEQKVLSLTQMWQQFQVLKENFVPNYVAYHYFRSKGWVPKSGLKFGCDLVLYKEGPPYFHGSYAVNIIAVTDNTLLPCDRGDGCNFDQRQPSWISLAAQNRITEHVAKELLLCYVVWPAYLNKEELLSPTCISKFKVKEVLVSRWMATQERESKEEIP